MTRLAFLGNFDAPHSTENHWKHAFEQIGLEVVTAQQDRTSRSAWERLASECDLATLSTTWGWRTPATERSWKRIRARGVRTFTLHLDLLLGLPRESFLLADRHPQFYGPERVWTSDGSHDEEWARLGIEHRWLPPAIHAPNAVMGIPREDLVCDVLFVGSVEHYHREWTRRPELIDQARARFGDRFRLVGGADAIRGPDLSDLYASATVVLGDSLCFDLEESRYLSDRVPETTGRGGLLVHPWNRASEAFVPATVSSGWDVDDQLDKVEEVLGWEPSLQAAFRLRARQTILGRHTYFHRAVDVLADLGGILHVPPSEGGP